MSANAPSTPLLQVAGLNVVLPSGERDEIEAVTAVDLTVADGERIGIVGESGSGKSVTGRAIAGLLPTSPRVRVHGSIRMRGLEMLGASRDAWDTVRSRTVSMVFQDPLTFLNPTMKIGRQVAESVRVHGGMPRADVLAHVHRSLAEAGLDRVEDVAERFPHELSGGMRQRVLIAIALAKQPELIIADEPTTALDATVQQRVLHTLEAAVTGAGASLILISHDVAVVAGMTDRIYVMYNGRIVEDGATDEVLHHPQHPYTQALLRSVRSVTDEGLELYSIPPALRRELAEEVARAS
nr:ABC transporter ATP-binding protein [Microbacterium bovistercoris]